MRWAETFYKLRRGDGCPFCQEGRPDMTRDGVRFYAGEVSDAYLRRTNIQRGLTVVVWRGRHVVEPTELTMQEATRYMPRPTGDEPAEDCPKIVDRS